MVSRSLAQSVWESEEARTQPVMSVLSCSLILGANDE